MWCLWMPNCYNCRKCHLSLSSRTLGSPRSFLTSGFRFLRLTVWYFLHTMFFFPRMNVDWHLSSCFLCMKLFFASLPWLFYCNGLCPGGHGVYESMRMRRCKNKYPTSLINYGIREHKRKQITFCINALKKLRS